MKNIYFLLITLIFGGYSCRTNDNFIGVDLMYKNSAPNMCDKKRLSDLGICDAIMRRLDSLDSDLACEKYVNTFSEITPYESDVFKNMKIIQVTDNSLFVARKHEGTVIVFLENNNKFQCKSRISGVIKGFFKSSKKYPDVLIERLHTYSSIIDFVTLGYATNCIYTWKNDTYVLKSILNYNGGNPIPKGYYDKMYSEFSASVRCDTL